MKCPTCGAANMAVVNKEIYKYEACGLPNVALSKIDMRTCDSCGEEMPVIPRLAALHRAIALSIIRKRSKFSGAEVAFLRKHLGFSSSDFAAVMGVTRETVSRWERETKPMGPTADRLLRMLVAAGEKVQDYGPADLKAIDDDPSTEPPSVVRLARQGEIWAAA